MTNRTAGGGTDPARCPSWCTLGAHPFEPTGPSGIPFRTHRKVDVPGEPGNPDLVVFEQDEVMIGGQAHCGDERILFRGRVLRREEIWQFVKDVTAACEAIAAKGGA